MPGRGPLVAEVVEEPLHSVLGQVGRNHDIDGGPPLAVRTRIERRPAAARPDNEHVPAEDVEPHEGDRSAGGAAAQGVPSMRSAQAFVVSSNSDMNFTPSGEVPMASSTDT